MKRIKEILISALIERLTVLILNEQVDNSREMYIDFLHIVKKELIKNNKTKVLKI